MAAAGRLPSWRDGFVAGAVAMIAVAEVLSNRAIDPKAVALGVELGISAALWWRYRRPLTVIVAISVLQVAEAMAGVPLEQPIVPLLATAIAMYTLVAHGSLRRGLAGCATVAVTVAVETKVQDKGFGNFAFAMIFVVGAFFVARTVAYRTRNADAMRERADEVELHRDADVRRATEAERSRIARELHDVIAHSVGVMVVQAGAAERVFNRDPDAAVAALHAVQSTGRQAIAEMARVVAILREGGQEVGLAPQPGLDDLSTLVAETRRGGLPVDMHVDGTPTTVAPALGLAVYRIVQEALTNIRKHAGETRATVRLSYTPATITTEITDTGNGTGHTTGDSAAPSDADGGHGLIGMRERVAMYGGTLQLDRAPGGGFVVRACLPLGELA